MPYAVITIPIDPIFHIGPLPLHWYGVGYAVAFLVALQFAERHVVRRGISREQATSVAFWTIVFGLIGARLYFDVQSGALYYVTHPQFILAAWQGGMAFFGAIFFSLATMLFLSWRRHLSFWVLFDAGAIFATVGQPIGRIGNLINGDILGPVSNLPWATRYTNLDSLAPRLGVAYQPAAVYEALCTLAILAVLLVLRRRRVADGILGLVYLALYPISQFGIFFLRSTEPPLWLGLKQAQWTSIGVLAIGVPLAVAAWWYTTRRRRGEEPASTQLTPA